MMIFQSTPYKLFFGDPVYYEILGGNPGTMREALTAAMVAEAGYSVEAHRDETCGDFFITLGRKKISLEIGGKAMRAKKSDFAIRDDTDIPTGKFLPLWTLGFMY